MERALVGHVEEVFEREEVGLEVEELAVVVEVAQIGRVVAQVEALEVRKIEQLRRLPMGDRSLEDDWLQRVCVWLGN